MSNSEMGGPITIYTDGACRGNPGPGGWGVVLLKGTKRKELCGGEPDTTNNRMELTAAIRALQALKRPCKVVLFSDSTYVVNGASKWLKKWKADGWRKSGRAAVANADLWQEVDRLLQIHRVSMKWVRGHTGDMWNERADRLANSGLSALAV